MDSDVFRTIGQPRNPHHGFPLLQLFAQDARYTMRQWRRVPGFALFTILVLALGIGTVTAMFTITYGVLLKPLPFQNSRQLFRPIERRQKGTMTSVHPTGRSATYRNQRVIRLMSRLQAALLIS